MKFSFALFFVISLTIHCQASIRSNWKSNDIYCQSSETKCDEGCCPHKEASCCDSGLTCCPQGTVCVENKCIGLQYNRRNYSISSAKATPLNHVKETCPDYTTECSHKCCPLPNAVCCSDGIHCCPHGYTCDLKSGTCAKNVSSPLLIERASWESKFLPQAGSFYRVCSEEDHECPIHTKCCITDSGEKGCCPVALKIPPAQNDCCMTMYGWKCCFGNQPFCSYLGCH